MILKMYKVQSLQQTIENVWIWVSIPRSDYYIILEVKQKKWQTDPYSRKTEEEANKSGR